MSYAPPQPSKGSGSTWIIVIGILAGLFFAFLVCAGILAALMIPAVQAARNAARRVQSSNNIKQINLALLNYEAVYKQFPPAFTVDQDGNRLHSWRTLLLPYIEQSALASKIDMSKPWDHPDNAFAVNLNVPTYISPLSVSSPGSTNYLAIVDPKSALGFGESRKMREITDGTSNTIWVFEVGDEQSVNWMDPNDATIQDFVATVEQGNLGGPGIQVGFVDGSVLFIPDLTNPADLEAMATRDGGETVFPPR